MPVEELPPQPTHTLQFPRQTTPPISNATVTPQEEAPMTPLQIGHHEGSPPIPKPRTTTPERGALTTPIQIANHEPSPPIPEPRPLATTPVREMPTQLLPTSNHEPSPPSIPEPSPLARTPESKMPAQLLPTSNHEPSPSTPEVEAPTQLLPTAPVPKPRTGTLEREVFTPPTQISNHEPKLRARPAAAPSASSQRRTSWLDKRNSFLLGESHDPKLQELLDKQKKKIQDNKSGESFRKLEATQRNKYTYESHTLPRSMSVSGRAPTAELQQWLEKRRSKIS